MFPFSMLRSHNWQYVFPRQHARCIMFSRESWKSLKRSDVAFVVDKRHFDATGVAHACVAVKSVFHQDMLSGSGACAFWEGSWQCVQHMHVYWHGQSSIASLQCLQMDSAYASAAAWSIIHGTLTVFCKLAACTCLYSTCMCINMISHPSQVHNAYKL